MPVPLPPTVSVLYCGGLVPGIQRSGVIYVIGVPGFVTALILSLPEYVTVGAVPRDPWGTLIFGGTLASGVAPGTVRISVAPELRELIMFVIFTAQPWWLLVPPGV